MTILTLRHHDWLGGKKEKITQQRQTKRNKLAPPCEYDREYAQVNHCNSKVINHTLSQGRK